MMRQSFTILISMLIGVTIHYLYITRWVVPESPVGSVIPTTPKEKPLEKYTIEHLNTPIREATNIVFDEAIATTSAYTKYHFHYLSDGKRVTGLATLPQPITPYSVDDYPVIVQFRGYVDRDIYMTGIGTQRSAEVYAESGFVTFAPDFLGYGGSDMPTGTIFEERFQTYTTARDLINALPSVPFIDPTKVGLWGHSNGGHIAITVLEALQQPLPTTLWAPVTKPFPYSILYFTDELDDEGKFLRKELAAFETDYDVNDYSLTKHIDRLYGPILLHQGTADDAVPINWNNEFVEALKAANKEVTYYTYPGADHNMLGAWDTVVSRDIEFFTEQFEL